ncbi:adenylate kinase isoenzyme 1-like [Pogonomyrmex barbatus]|uniref:Adenylate kinase isoenzyme 1-like n=1 Tax=Pogonomyrmex barbatus TaxID=144034 RepID=A0A6I9W5V2_9HYME|nr:adenylate kinase isoenzyme 1-like [Pogonomyrmex barbatus]
MGLNCVRPVDPLCAVIPRDVGLDASPIRDSRLPIIFLIGGSGAGKCLLNSTQCLRVAKHYGFCAMISKELLRSEITTGSQRGIILAYLMSEDKLIPADVMVQLIIRKMLQELKTTRGFLLSGFPREKLQCQHFDRQIRPPDLVLYLYVRNTLLIDRVLARTITVTERQETGSFDKHWKRIKEQGRMNKFVLKYYKKRLVVIDGEKEEAEVFQDICNAIDSVLKEFPSTSGGNG